LIIPRAVLPYHCDVLVYDTLGSSWIHQIIPDSASWTVLDIRRKRPIFPTPGFLFYLTKHYFCHKGISSNRRYSSYISAVFDHIKPKIILTFADNNVVLGHYATYSPNTLVVSIQNAIRGTIDSIPPKTVLPIYYSLGQAEKEVFKAIGITHLEYTPVGSVKLGLYLQQHYKPDNRWDLSYCSHYRPELLDKNASKLFKLIESAHRDLFQLTCRYARSRKLSIAVLSKTREPIHQNMEEQYFRDLADGTPFSLILADKSNNEFETYHGAFRSRLIINLCSTLGYEALGAGAKVLFGSGYRQDLLENWGAVQYYDKLPNFISLQSDSLTTFSDQADKLLSMDDARYKQQTQDASRYYITMPHNDYPHEVIRKRLANHLAKATAS